MDTISTKDTKINHDIFGSFFLNQSEFAISVSFIQEVVNPPDSYTNVPLGPQYLKGLFNLRGMIIPVIDLKILLNIKNVNECTNSKKISIIDFDGYCIGLLFDKTGEIFTSQPEERSDFESKDDQSIICGVFKKNAGKRIVQILNIQALFKLQNIPKQDKSQLQKSKGGFSRQRGARKQCISFVVGPSKCALGISDIQEILHIDKVNEPELSLNHCIGTIDLRGTIVPIIDFASLLKYRETDRSPTATSGDRRVVVMRIDQEFFGLMVDSVDSIISYFADDLMVFPVLNKERAEMFIGCISLSAGFDIILLNHSQILSNAEINEITRGHSQLYKITENKLRENIKKQGGPRKTYITFSVENTYAIQIEETKEIIDYPKSLLQLPGLPGHIKGVLNLRGELVTIVDARSMYSKEDQTERQNKKVLIFKKEKAHFGLVVDSIEAIIAFSDNEKIKIPNLLYQGDSGSLAEDVSEAVEVNYGRDQRQSLLILNVNSVAERVGRSLAA